MNASLQRSHEKVVRIGRILRIRLLCFQTLENDVHNEPPTAVGRGNWTFFGSDAGGRTAAILRTFIASCKRNGVEPFAWFRDVLSRIGAHPVNRIAALLPHNWKPLTANV
jgi:hypothetical protein